MLPTFVQRFKTGEASPVLPPPPCLKELLNPRPAEDDDTVPDDVSKSLLLCRQIEDVVVVCELHRGR